MIRSHKTLVKGRARALNPGRQALLTLVRLRKNETYTELTAGFGVGIATAHRYVAETTRLLARLAPTIEQALIAGARKLYVVIDGTLIRINRVRSKPKGRDNEFFSGKIRAHAMNVQVIAGPLGDLLWTSAERPGARHDVRACKELDLPDLLTDLVDQGVRAPADKGYRGTGASITAPFQPHRKIPGTKEYLPLSENQKACNRAHAKLRAPGERANAQLKTSRILTRLRDSTARTTTIIHTITTLIIHDKARSTENRRTLPV